MSFSNFRTQENPKQTGTDRQGVARHFCLNDLSVPGMQPPFHSHSNTSSSRDKNARASWPEGLGSMELRLLGFCPERRDDG